MGKGKAKAKKVDPADGLTYTFDELVEYYKGKYTKDTVKTYWEKECTSQDDGNRAEPGRIWKKSEAAPSPSSSSTSPQRPQLRRTRSWLKKVGGITLLPCEEALAPLVESYAACVEASDGPGLEAAQLAVLQQHPFVDSKSRDVPAGALPDGVSCEISNFKMNVFKFKKWLNTPEGKPFEEKGKGFDDGCYLTSAVLRAFMPRGFTHFHFTSASGGTASAVLRGFFKFTGLTAADEDEESNATAEADSFMFHGYKMEAASRFVVTTKSNGENGKYAVRKIFGDWYCFAGSKNTGVVWKVGSDAASLYPIPTHDSNAAVGPKIVNQIHGILSQMPDAKLSRFMEAVDADSLTVMIELNDDEHEHIFPIPSIRSDHVAVLNSSGYPLPQKQAYSFFDEYGLGRVKCDDYSDMSQLSGVMEEIRKSKDTEGAVIYLERSDDVAVGLIKVKSDHYVVARRMREILRSSLINASKGKDLDALLKETRKRLENGMKLLKHVAGCDEKHEAWAQQAVGFAESWAAAFAAGDATRRKALVIEFHNKFGSLYDRFLTTQSVLPLSKHSLEQAAMSKSDEPASPSAEHEDDGDEMRGQSRKGRGKGKKR